MALTSVCSQKQKFTLLPRRAPVDDLAAGEAGEDRCQGGQPWPVRDVPIGKGGDKDGKGGKGGNLPLALSSPSLAE